MVSDSHGRPVKLHLTPGNDHDSTAVPELIDFVPGDNCIADKAYDSDEILNSLKERGIKAVIPPTSHRKKKRRHDKKLYALRYLIECGFHGLKRCRRLATRFDKTVACYAGFVHVAASLAWII